MVQNDRREVKNAPLKSPPGVHFYLPGTLCELGTCLEDATPPPKKKERKKKIMTVCVE